MKKTIFVIAMIPGLVMMAGAAQAQGPRDRPDFATLDLNGDGVVTQEEIAARGEARFAAADSNGDGALSAEELAAAASANAADRVAQMLDRLDANEDGVLQQSEMQPRGGDRGARMFERLDADGDGAVSEAEFDDAKDRHRGRGPRDRG